MTIQMCVSEFMPVELCRQLLRFRVATAHKLALQWAWPLHDPVNWFGKASRRSEKFTQCSLLCLWVSASHHVLGWLCTTCSTPAFELGTCGCYSTVASTVQRQTLDNNRRWQPIWCQLWRAVTRLSLWPQTLTSALALLLDSVIPWQCCSAYSCAFDVALWVKTWTAQAQVEVNFGIQWCTVYHLQQFVILQLRGQIHQLL